MLKQEVEQSELSNRGDAKWDNSLENGLTFSYKVKPISSFDSAIPLPRSVPRRNENLCPHKDLCKNGESYIHNSPKLDTSKMFNRTDTQTVVSNSEILLSNKQKKLTAHATTWIQLRNIF